ncbi:pentatricopeptide repeat-containing protein At1g05600 isoform X1 [Coffea arabica]|uniref:Pentatricopeptide repeat-containing protein At1g05600 isoform X1 n=1 Tax=Coffea arabica TaxID=13443 RepID=A0A6P6VBP9_COFAR|nr:pentatricopeptide repeat-containing protein At1g05600-like isoform X1 [Coffea arabica]XP_027099384.1 pentatricopeptide repeat-containing protein At1g05600-like isoform X1 [Coffea arabica]
MNIRWPRLLTPTQLSQIIKSQKNPLKALQIFREAKCRYPGYRHNGPVYNTIISILGNSGRIAEMKEVICQMRDDSCECRDSVFAGAIRTYSKACLLGEAIALFRSLPQFNCVNWTESFNTLLEIMVKESKLETAHLLFLENFSSWEVKSRTQSLNLLINALCQLNRSDLALNVFQEMYYQCCNPDRETYRILMRGLCQDGRLNEATHLLYSMFWRISERGSSRDVAIYRILLDTLCDNGEAEEAVNILGKVLRKGLKAPKRYHKHLDLSECYSGGRADITSMKVLINEALIRGGVPNTDGYITMAIDLYSEGKINGGDKVLSEMQDRGFRPSSLVFEAKVAALCRDGRFDDAVAVLEREMVEKNCVPSVKLYNAVIKGLSEGRKSMFAIRYLERMSRQIGCGPDHETYTLLVDGLCNDGKYVEASNIVEEMSNNSFRPRNETYNKLIQGLCLTGSSYNAIMWLEELISEAKIPELSTWNSLVSSVCSESVCTQTFSDTLKLLVDSS